MAYSSIHINQLRQQILQSRPTTVPKKSGFYRWWFPADIAKSMLSSIPLVDINKIVKRNIGGKEYWLLYFGISSNLFNRIKWHVCQKHKPSAVRSGTLSTLRQTISSLLGIDETLSESDVNNVLDQCYWEWHEESQPEEIEEKELSTGYYPLNIQKNKVVPKDILKKLKQLRKTYKK